MNLYAYANGNPVNYTDPQGTQAFNNALTNVATQNTCYFGDIASQPSWVGSQSLATLTNIDNSWSNPIGNITSPSKGYASSFGLGMKVASGGFASKINNSSESDLTIEDTLFMTGTSVDIAKNTVVNNGQWLGVNGKYNSLDWGGNAFTGARANAKNVAGALEFAGRGIFAANTINNTYEGTVKLLDHNYSGAAGSATSIGADYAALRLGGWPGIILGVGYNAIMSNAYDKYMWPREY
jgi:hypothetical protein